jgi:hypothetical protein
MIMILISKNIIPLNIILPSRGSSFILTSSILFYNVFFLLFSPAFLSFLRSSFFFLSFFLVFLLFLLSFFLSFFFLLNRRDEFTGNWKIFWKSHILPWSMKLLFWSCETISISSFNKERLSEPLRIAFWEIDNTRRRHLQGEEKGFTITSFQELLDCSCKSFEVSFNTTITALKKKSNYHNTTSFLCENSVLLNGSRFDEVRFFPYFSFLLFVFLFLVYALLFLVVACCVFDVALLSSFFPCFLLS